MIQHFGAIQLRRILTIDFAGLEVSMDGVQPAKKFLESIKNSPNQRIY